MKITQTGTTVTSGATSANVAAPTAQNSLKARYIRLVSNTLCYVKFGLTNTVVATANDIMITNHPQIFDATGIAYIAYLQDAVTTAGKLNIIPVENC